jgi:putative ABC transport system substrate-binding protein
VEGAAGLLGLKLQYFDVLALKDIEPAFRAAAKARTDAVIWLVSGGVANVTQAQAALRNANNRLPVIYGSQSYVEAGGLMSYGINIVDLARRAAYFVDKILKGANPAAIPVEQPTKFEFVINLKTANQIGLSIPQWTLLKAFRQGLRELGYVDGKNIVIEWRAQEGIHGRLPALAAELVRLQVSVIVATGSGDVRAAKEATTTIPIVMIVDSDPVGRGFIASLARPGGSITGLTNFAPELSGKRLELLKEIVPKFSHVAIFGTSTSEGNAQELTAVDAVAKAFGVKLQFLDVRGPKDFDTAFRTAESRTDGALMMVSGAVAVPHRTEIAALAVKSRIPVIYQRREYVEAGGLLSYGVNIADMDRRAATYVDKILKGAKPADLPVEQPTKFEFIINLKAAKQIGLTIPPNVLARADEVIK